MTKLFSNIFCMRLIAVWTFFALTFSIFAPFNVKAQKDRQLTQEENKPQKRIALVIGNSTYTKARVLPNPSNDAADMAQALRDLGFEVLSGTNLNKRQTETLIREFGVKLAVSGGVGLFYYAGHGIQVNGENYLVPVDADIPEEDEVGYAAVPVSLVLTKMTTAKNDLNIIILDACRNNPFARSWRTFRDNSNNDGLAKISPPTGTLVLYATEPGKVASDGAGRNGLFTESLLNQIKKPNVEYDQLVKAVSVDVWRKSNKQQLPWKEGNSLQDFYFVRSEITNISKTQTNESESPIVAKDILTQEKEAWDLVKNSNDEADFRTFLKNFPSSENLDEANSRLEELVWQSVRDSNNSTKIQSFLKEFSNGKNAPIARLILQKLTDEKKDKEIAGKETNELNKTPIESSASIKSDTTINKERESSITDSVNEIRSNFNLKAFDKVIELGLAYLIQNGQDAEVNFWVGYSYLNKKDVGNSALFLSKAILLGREIPFSSVKYVTFGSLGSSDEISNVVLTISKDQITVARKDKLFKISLSKVNNGVYKYYNDVKNYCPFLNLEGTFTKENVISDKTKETKLMDLYFFGANSNLVFKRESGTGQADRYVISCSDSGIVPLTIMTLIDKLRNAEKEKISPK